MDREGDPERVGTVKGAAADPRQGLRNQPISVRLDLPAPQETTAASGRQIVPEMTVIGIGKAATIRVDPPAHHERERQG